MSRKKEIFLIPYSHLDTQWRWEYPTTINKYIKNTLDESLALFKKYPEHRFNFTGTIRYAMMKDYFPESYEEVKRLVREGRWSPAGTCLDETDALVPSSESMVRNILYGDRWQKREFGRSSRDYMIPDCFGFPANMPTIMAHCGIHGFSSNKLTWGSAVGIPFEIGVWKGPDGSEIVSALNPCRYDSHLELPVHLNPARLARLKRLGKKNGVWKSFQYYGVGDIGGAPREGSVRRALASIRHFAARAGDMRVRQGSADEFFGEITGEEKARMDRYEGDFLLTNHSAGTITSAAIMKRWNRMNEQLAFAAEEAAVTAMLCAGLPYPADKIESAWTRMIGSQMHDILPGTSTPSAYEYAHNDEVVALKTWTVLLEDSAEAIASYVEGDGEILLYNPLDQPRREPVDMELELPEDFAAGPVVLESGSGAVYPGELKKGNGDRYDLAFIPELPPAGWTRFSLRPAESPEEETVTDPVSLTSGADGFILENRLHRVRISGKGALSSVFHKGLNRELLEKPLAYEFQKERPLKFPAWNMDWRDRKKTPFKRIEEGGAVQILEVTPLRCKIRIVTEYGSSRFVREVSLAAGSELVDITERIHWRETGCSLKLAVTAALESPAFTCNWETSRMEREVNHKKTFEMPSRLWADLSGRDHGLSILEDSKYGWDRPKGNTIRMTLLYTPALRYINGFLDQKSQDWGDHTIRYGLYGHSGDWRGTDKPARAFNQPVRAFLVKGGVSTEAQEAPVMPPLLTLSNDQLAVMAVKKKEEADSIILRFYEREGRDGRAVVTFACPLESVVEVNGLEEPQGVVEHSGNSFEIALGANGVKAFALKLKKEIETARTDQTILPLEYDTPLIGRNGESPAALFPAEITPAALQAGSIGFSLAVEAEKNGLSCRGQQIKLPEGHNRISLLTGARESCNAPFKWLDREGRILKEEIRRVSSMTGFAGQWDRRLWKRTPKHHLKKRRDYAWLNRCIGVEPGFVNRERLEWAAAHTHEKGRDRAYRYGYLYNVTLAIPRGAASLVLPQSEGVYLLAATASRRETEVKSIRKLSDQFDF